MPSPLLKNMPLNCEPEETDQGRTRLTSRCITVSRHAGSASCHLLTTLKSFPEKYSKLPSCLALTRILKNSMSLLAANDEGKVSLDGLEQLGRVLISLLVMHKFSRFPLGEIENIMLSLCRLLAGIEKNNMSWEIHSKFYMVLRSVLFYLKESQETLPFWPYSMLQAALLCEYPHKVNLAKKGFSKYISIHRDVDLKLLRQPSATTLKPAAEVLSKTYREQLTEAAKTVCHYLAIIRVVRKVVNELFDDMVCLPFGSFVNFLLLPSSDLDLNLREKKSLPSKCSSSKQNLLNFLPNFDDEDNKFFGSSEKLAAIGLLPNHLNDSVVNFDLQQPDVDFPEKQGEDFILEAEEAKMVKMCQDRAKMERLRLKLLQLNSDELSFSDDLEQIFSSKFTLLSGTVQIRVNPSKSKNFKSKDKWPTKNRLPISSGELNGDSSSNGRQCYSVENPPENGNMSSFLKSRGFLFNGSIGLNSNSRWEHEDNASQVEYKLDILLDDDKIRFVTTRFVKCYFYLGAEIHSFIYLIKYWATSRKILGRKEGFFSSYEWFILCVFFLEHCPYDSTGEGGPLVESLFLNVMKENKRKKVEILEKDFVSFFGWRHPLSKERFFDVCTFDMLIKLNPDVACRRATISQATGLSSHLRKKRQSDTLMPSEKLRNVVSAHILRAESVDTIIMNFFMFYLKSFDFREYMVSLKSRELVRKRRNPSQGECAEGLCHTFSLKGMDPFRDVIFSVCCKKLATILGEFERGYDILEKGYNAKELFEKAK